MHVLYTVAIILHISAWINGYRILFVAMPEGGSHRGSMYPFAKALVNHGHDVTIFSEAVIDHSKDTPPVKEHLVQLKEFDSDMLALVYQNSTEFKKMLWEWDSNALGLFIPWQVGTKFCKSFLDNQIEEFKAVANDKWDLVFVDELFAPCGIGIATLNKAPNIIFQTSLLDNPTASMRGISHVPQTTPPFMAAPQHAWTVTSFFDRVSAVTESWAIQYVILGTFVNRFLRSSIGRVAPGISIEEYSSSASAVFIDYPEAVDYTRPVGLDNIYVGSSCTGKTKGKPLPDDLDKFVNDPKSKGTILVAFGTMGNWATAPKALQERFFSALKRMEDYRIIFQFKGDPSIFPPHIKATKWLPQTDILLHPKTKLFISHGGLKSFKETVCAAVPVLYVPLFGEQIRNAMAAQTLGFGERVKKQTFDADSLVTKMKLILESKKYKENMEKVRAIWLDHPMPQLDEGVFWAEYIARNGGMPSLYKRRSVDLYWFQHWCLDVVSSLIASFVVLMLFALKIAKLVIGRILEKK